MHHVGVASGLVENCPGPVRDLKDMVKLWVSSHKIQVHHTPRAVDECDPLFRVYCEGTWPEGCDLDDNLSGAHVLGDGGQGHHEYGQHCSRQYEPGGDAWSTISTCESARSHLSSPRTKVSV